MGTESTLRSKTAVAIVETHQLHADALALLLGRNEHFSVVAASTFDNMTPDLGAGVVLLAIDNPRGIQLAASITVDDSVRVVGLHGGMSRDLAARSFDARVRAAVRRDLGAAPIIDVLLGELSSSSLGAPEAKPAIVLSDRELAVLEMIAGGRTASEIARRLHTSNGETLAAKRRALRKLGARTQSDAVARARRLGLLGPAPLGPR